MSAPPPAAAQRPDHGGSFLAGLTKAADIRVVEQLTDEHRAILATVEEFWRRDVEPRLPAVQRLEPGVARDLLRKSSTLGLTSMQIPASYGGLDLDLSAVMGTIERLSGDASYVGWHIGHSGLGVLPIVYFGTEAQKQRYLPRLSSVDLLGAYALTEPHSGSDALAARTRAALTPDGRFYELNGQKSWITNGGEADLFIVFAKVDAERFTAFLVERAFGVTSGEPEQKMGLHGTSTTSLHFDQVRVPVENVLGEVGQGHRIALNTLNVGRLKLGPVSLGGAKGVLRAALAYAATREAFGTTLATFGAIRQKLADSAVRIYAIESASWRVVGLVESRIAFSRARGGTSNGKVHADLAAFEEFAAECSMIKVAASEMLDVVADHGVQIHGGYGFHKDYYVERAFRDARVNRIFEGTNEINRLLIPGLILKRAARAGSPLLEEASAALDTAIQAADGAPAATDGEIVARARTITLLLLAAAHRRHGDALREQQEVTMYLADAMIELFVMESALLRATALEEQHSASAAGARDLATICVHDAIAHVAQVATHALASLMDPAGARTAIAAVRELAATEPLDTIATHQRIAMRLLELGQYGV